MSERSEFWLRREGETEYAYGAFAIYRDLGPARRLRQAVGVFYGREDVGPEEHEYVQFKRWSAQHLWRARSEAYDAEQEALLLQRMQGYRLQALEDHHRICRLYLQILSKKAVDVLRGEDHVPSGALPGLIGAVSSWHRLVLGQATERLETAAADPDQHQPDYSRLTDEEIEFLDRLGERLYGEGNTGG